MKRKIILTFVITIILGLISSCNNCGGFKDKCKNGVHGELEWVIINDSTCMTLGQKNQVCKSCKEVITTATINYKNHTEKIISGLAPTCIEIGSDKYLSHIEQTI